MDDSAVARALNSGMTISQMQARIAKLERQLADRQRAAAMQANVNARLGYITTSAGAALCDVSADGATIALEFDNKATAQITLPHPYRVCNVQAAQVAPAQKGETE